MRGLVGLALVEVDGAADGPDAAVQAIDPQRDPLRVAAIVAADDHPLGVPVAVRVTLLHRLPPRSVSRGGDPRLTLFRVCGGVGDPCSQTQRPERPARRPRARCPVPL